MKILSLLGAVVLTCASVLPFGDLLANPSSTASSDANNIIQETGVANRLVAGEVLRSLTQEIPAAACHLHYNVNVEDATELLTVGAEQINELLDALLFGDIYWGIEFPETRRKTIAEIEALRADWAPVLDAGRRLLGDPANSQNATAVSDAANMLFDNTYALLTTLDAQYSGSAEILSRDVMFIQVSGRMAALNQGMALKACQLWSGELDAEIAADLQQTMRDYQGSLLALSDGLPAVGIMPPQTPGIADKLAEISEIWRQNHPLLALVAVGEEISDAQRHDLYYQLIDERVLLLDLLYLYQDHAIVRY